MSTTGQPAIALRGLAKRYGRLEAVRNLNLEVAVGEVFGFLGLNGAGKTTTIRMLLDLLRPTHGSAVVFGQDCQRQGLEVRARVGYLPGEIGLYGDMRGEEALDLLARLQGAAVDARDRTLLLQRLRLSPADLRKRIREYSSGMRRKLGLVMAFQGDPDLLILDEPTEGLDPLMQEAFYELLSEVRRRGRTVFMSSHVLSEVGRVCDRIGIIRDGQLVLVARLDEIRTFAARRVKVVFGIPVSGPPERLPSVYEVVALEPTVWEFRVRGPLGPLMGELAALPVDDLEVQEPGLEEVLMAYYREDSPAASSSRD